MAQAAKHSPIWTITDDKVKEVIRRIVSVAAPKRIILFGSYNRGQTHADSDLDILVVKTSVGNRLAELHQLTLALRGLFVAVDLLLVEESELTSWGDVPGSVYRNALSEGRIAYEAE
jgi:predicted nucleotidyltransferase